MVDDINTLILGLICNIRTRNHFEVKSRDQIEDATYQLHRLLGIPSESYNCVPCQKVETKKVTDFFSCETWSVNYGCYSEIANWSCADTSCFKFRWENFFFFMKILLILPKFHEKSLSRPGDIKFFCPGRRNYMYTLPYLWTKSLCLQQKIVLTKCLI